MDYRYIKAFILTAQFSSFSKAAESLKIAQSAVSRQIKLLEESLGEELIIRSSKKVLLTNRGRELFLAAQQFDKFAVDIFQKEDSRPIKIGILHGLLKTWFTPILTKYLKKTDRSIYIKIEDHPELKRGIEDGKFDIIFTTENIQSELISSLKLFDEKVVLISKNEVNKKKLHEYRWIAYSENDMLYRLSKKHATSILEIDSITTIMDMVRAGVGIATVPDHVLKKNDTLNIYELPGLPKSEIYMTTLNYKSMPSHIKEIADMVQF
jgi:DNA-binding transcriptional LysR family regulator